ncbi:MAG TPA: sortase [Candidatus Limnocylindrales bacterium]|nr:sortase [Candidatus Limnocylindrales bacterium]
MPTAARPARSLLALALLVNLLAASAPATVSGTQRQAIVPPPSPTIPAVPPWSPQPADRHERVATVAAGARPSTMRAVPALTDWISRAKPDVPDPRPTAVSKQHTSAGPATVGSFKGRNHVWIPALGIDRSVSWYACSSSFYPGNRVYRWGCAGTNNIYLFGHAHSVFKALHDAYVRGKLKKGMKVYYAGADGKVGTYAVSWWKVTTPERGTWAYAGQEHPSLTLQTCVGAKSQYRLIVRLAKVGSWR